MLYITNETLPTLWTIHAQKAWIVYDTGLQLKSNLEGYAYGLPTYIIKGKNSLAGEDEYIVFVENTTQETVESIENLTDQTNLESITFVTQEDKDYFNRTGTGDSAIIVYEGKVYNGSSYNDIETVLKVMYPTIRLEKLTKARKFSNHVWYIENNKVYEPYPQDIYIIDSGSDLSFIPTSQVNKTKFIFSE